MPKEATVERVKKMADSLQKMKSSGGGGFGVRESLALEFIFQSLVRLSAIIECFLVVAQRVLFAFLLQIKNRQIVISIS